MSGRSWQVNTERRDLLTDRCSLAVEWEKALKCAALIAISQLAEDTVISVLGRTPKVFENDSR
jgi:hypothetical protein